MSWRVRAAVAVLTVFGASFVPGPPVGAATDRAAEAPTRAEERDAQLDARVRAVLLELLLGEPPQAPKSEEPVAEEDLPEVSDEELKARVARVLRELLVEKGVPPTPGKKPTEEEPAVARAALAAERGPVEPEAVGESDISAEEQERGRTVYDEGAQLIQDELTFGGFVQMTFNEFLQDHPTQGEYEIPRARLDVRGAAAEGFSYRIFWDMDRSGARLEDAWLEWTPFLALRGRLGQTKVPFSLEALYSARWIRFSERALGPRNLAPFRDVGLQVFGRGLGDRVEYAAGFFNGPDAKGAANAGTETALRLSWQATRFLALPFSQGIHLGASFTHRDVSGSLAGIDYDTSAGTRFFEFVSDVDQRGKLMRLGVEAEWIHGPVYVAGELMRLRRENLMLGEVSVGRIDSDSAYLGVSWIFTGEEQTRNRAVVPIRRADSRTGSWGAFDIHARLDYFETSPEALDLGLALGTDRVWAVTGGVNWWPRTNLRTVLELEYASFDDPIAVGDDTINEEWVVKILTQFEF
jgi:phosphate-selective porin